MLLRVLDQRSVSPRFSRVSGHHFLLGNACTHTPLCLCVYRHCSSNRFTDSKWLYSHKDIAEKNVRDVKQVIMLHLTAQWLHEDYNIDNNKGYLAFTIDQDHKQQKRYPRLLKICFCTGTCCDTSDINWRCNSALEGAHWGTPELDWCGVGGWWGIRVNLSGWDHQDS